MARLMPAWFALCLALFTADVAVAETYPAHPIRIIVSSAAGGPLDVICRAVAERISAELKQPVVVEAKPGAGGNLAADFVSKSAPDGYTLLFTLSTTLTVNPYLYKDLSFNLKPITVVNYSTQTLFVHPTLPVSNIAEFIAWAKLRQSPLQFFSRHCGDGVSDDDRPLKDVPHPVHQESALQAASADPWDREKLDSVALAMAARACDLLPW